VTRVRAETVAGSPWEVEASSVLPLSKKKRKKKEKEKREIRKML
jgi:hypothetical protein